MKTWSLALMVLLIMLFSGVSGICSDSVTQGTAIVAVRTSSVGGLGHVGVAFQNADGTWTAGAIEGAPERSWYNWGGAIVFQTENGGWTKQYNTREEVEKEFSNRGYDKIKIIPVENSNPEAANNKIQSFEDAGYIPAINDCLTQIWGVLDAYGFKNPGFVEAGTNMADTISRSLERLGGLTGSVLYPNDYYNSLPGEEILLAQQSADLQPSNQETAKFPEKEDNKDTTTTTATVDALSEGISQNSQPKITEKEQSMERSTDADSASYKSTIPIPIGSAADALKEQGKYDEYLQNALQSAEERIAQDSQDGDAWYTKGLALYYLNRGAEADAAFAKAKELGYISAASSGEPSADTPHTDSTSYKSNTKDSSVIPTLYPTTSTPLDESNTKESSIIPTLYPTTSPPPDETNTKEGSVIPTLYPTTTPPPNEQENDLPFGNVQETAQQAKQSETKDPTDGLDPNLEGKRLAAEAFKETYQSTEQSENADSTSYKSIIPTPTGAADESNTKESSVATTLYPITSPPPDESNAKESDLGGVNFTSIKLSYISVTTDSSGEVNFDLILKAQKAEGTSPGINIQNATRIGATAFMTGLVVNDNKFWVNLDPWKLDRIIDVELGQSEVGRIMLEADLQMKRDFSNYGNPCANETGKALWSLLDKKREALVQQCMKKFPGEIRNIDNVGFRPVTRHWIIPDKAYAYSNGTQNYIINSTLTINSEPVADHTTFEVYDQDMRTLSKDCLEELNKSAKIYGEYDKYMTDRMILQYVVTDVNHGEKYEDLREVYVALALAQWYKSKTTPHTDIFRDGLDSSSSAVLKSQKTWRPKDIWDKYVYSFKNGEYKCWENTTTKTAGRTRTKSSLRSSGGIEFDGIKDHLISIEVMPPEVRDQVNRAVSNGFVNQSKDILFGYRLHVDPKKKTSIAVSSSASSSDSLNSKQTEKISLSDNRADNVASLANEAALVQGKETPSFAKAVGNASHITCPDGWMGPDENGECWQMQITS